eukprot:EG_transcript_8209
MLGRHVWHFGLLLAVVLVSGFFTNYHVKVIVNTSEFAVNVGVFQRAAEGEEEDPALAAHRQRPAAEGRQPKRRTANPPPPPPAPAAAPRAPVIAVPDYPVHQAEPPVDAKPPERRVENEEQTSKKVSVELKYNPRTCSGMFIAVAKDCAHPTGFFMDNETETLIKQRLGPNEYRFVLSGPELVAADHIVANAEHCVTHHPFALGTAGTYHVSAHRTGTHYHTVSRNDPTEPEEPLHTVPALQCLATAPPSTARCNRTSQGRWVGGRWLGLGCSFPSPDRKQLRGRSFVFYGDRVHRSLFSPMVELVRDVLHPGLELPSFLYSKPWLEMGRVGGRRTLSVTVVIRDMHEHNVSARVSFIADPAGAVSFDGFYNYFTDEEGRTVKNRAKVFSSRGVPACTQGLVGPNVRWENRSKWSDGKYPPVTLYTAHLYGFSRGLFTRVPLTVIAQQLRALERLLETKADLIDSQMYWLLAPPEPKGTPVTGGALLSRLANLYVREALRPAETLRFIDLFAMAAALPPLQIYNGTYPRQIAEYLLGEMMADVLDSAPPVPAEGGQPEPLPHLPPPA